MIDIIDVIDSVVDSMRKTGSILSIADNANNTYTVTVDDIENLSNNDYITISGTTNFNGEFQITGVSGNTFLISKASGQATESGTWKANAPYYLPGHLVDIVQVNAIKDKNPSTRSQKYPLIILALDVKRDVINSGILYNAKPSIIIANETHPDWRATKRKTENFDPILDPLYDDFMEALTNNQYIGQKKIKDIPHERWDRYYWGRMKIKSGNEKHSLNEHLDAIELNSLKLSIIRTSTCVEN